MSLTIEQTDTAIRETFYNMEEYVEYVFNDFWFSEANRVRKEYGYSLLNNKQDYIFSREGNGLYVHHNFVFDFGGKDNLALSFALGRPYFLAAFAFALQHNGIEKLKSDTCDGKVVEIDGKKYKLTAV
jgi:hypothetical protein